MNNNILLCERVIRVDSVYVCVRLRKGNDVVYKIRSSNYFPWAILRLLPMAQDCRRRGTPIEHRQTIAKTVANLDIYIQYI